MTIIDHYLWIGLIKAPAGHCQRKARKHGTQIKSSPQSERDVFSSGEAYMERFVVHHSAVWIDIPAHVFLCGSVCGMTWSPLGIPRMVPTLMLEYRGIRSHGIDWHLPIHVRLWHQTTIWIGERPNGLVPWSAVCSSKKVQLIISKSGTLSGFSTETTVLERTVLFGRYEWNRPNVRRTSTTKNIESSSRRHYFLTVSQ